MPTGSLIRLEAMIMLLLAALGLQGGEADAGRERQGDVTISRRQIVLRDSWLVKQLENGTPDIAALARESAAADKTWLTARMPAQVHDILLERGLIPDPHVGKNAAASTWVAEKDWAYVCRFVTPEAVAGRAFLRFEGLDTLADAYLNGKALGHFENMYREFAVEVQDQLAPPGQQNTLLIVFPSPRRYLREAKQAGEDANAPKHKVLRKCFCDFGSYLGAAPDSVKVGIYRDVVLDLPGQAWIEDVCIRTELAPDRRQAQVRVRVQTAGAQAGLRWALTDPAGREVASGSKDETAGGSGTAFQAVQGHGQDARATGGIDLQIAVKEPQLWWPRMNGTPNLYALDIRLCAGERVLDRRRTAFGIREVKPVLADPATGEKRFRFDINGQPIFMRGGDWVPVEGATHVWQPQRALRLLDLAEHANVNILRIWGEGVLPPDSFYDECDRRGICVWQDFMFGYYDHAKEDASFLENCRAEIEQTICRLRNHPSVLLWVGGNEQYLWSPSNNVPETKREVFERMMPEACKRLDPTRLFHTSSPYGGSPTGNWPLEGDWHDYTTINFAPQASVPLFGSEVLRASPPPLASMRRFLSDEELWPKGFDPAIRKPGQPAWPPMWSYRSTGIATWDRVGAVQEFCDPASAEDLIRILGTAHGEYLRGRVERERRGVPDGQPDGNRRCWGNIVWRFNDAWPIIYSSVVDYYLEPKIAYYFMRRAYEPVLLSFERTPDKIWVWVINDSAQPVAGTLAVQRLGFDGKTHGGLQREVSVKPGEARRCLDTTDLGEISLRSQFLRATLAPHPALSPSGRGWGEGACDATCLLIGERYLHLPQAHLAVRKENERLEIETDLFARQVTLRAEAVSGAVFEDNYFDLAPGQKRTVGVIFSAEARKITIQALNAEAVTIPWDN